jgi:hypothetical protein
MNYNPNFPLFLAWFSLKSLLDEWVPISHFLTHKSYLIFYFFCQGFLVFNSHNYFLSFPYIFLVLPIFNGRRKGWFFQLFSSNDYFTFNELLLKFLLDCQYFHMAFSSSNCLEISTYCISMCYKTCHKILIRSNSRIENYT